MSIGVIGRGFVGNAIEKLLIKNNIDVKSYDLKDDRELNIAYEDIVKTSHMIYLCLPTPMNKNGSCCIDIVESSLKVINYYSNSNNVKPIILVKSTLVPETIKNFQEKYQHIFLVHNPEFLTERTAEQDFETSKIHLFGLSKLSNNQYVIKTIIDFHEYLFNKCKTIFVDSTESELIKYLTNSFFAVKVSFANHIYELCNKLNIDYMKFINNAINTDPRIGELHWQVPGHDGKLGFGGSCFPKDLNGMINLFYNKSLNPYVLQAAKDYNDIIRPEKDWENLKGRAVIE